MSSKLNTTPYQYGRSCKKTCNSIGINKKIENPTVSSQTGSPLFNLAYSFPNSLLYTSP